MYIIKNIIQSKTISNVVFNYFFQNIPEPNFWAHVKTYASSHLLAENSRFPEILPSFSSGHLLNIRLDFT